jgi:hypothetical protein
MFVNVYQRVQALRIIIAQPKDNHDNLMLYEASTSEPWRTKLQESVRRAADGKVSLSSADHERTDVLTWCKQAAARQWTGILINVPDDQGTSNHQGLEVSALSAKVSYSSGVMTSRRSAPEAIQASILRISSGVVKVGDLATMCICRALEMGLSEAALWKSLNLGLIVRGNRVTHMALGECSSTPGALV